MPRKIFHLLRVLSTGRIENAAPSRAAGKTKTYVTAFGRKPHSQKCGALPSRRHDELFQRFQENLADFEFATFALKTNKA
jgi:hypothetical protein